MRDQESYTHVGIITLAEYKRTRETRYFTQKL